ncbi:hypothetical protein [Magnetococcus sp. PR-3]|uniref:hypothetical protein n=1 Tax=Magnetococcus sp. PR-3 TaxID=3120355 RepID=UPI002FCE62EF
MKLSELNKAQSLKGTDQVWAIVRGFRRLSQEDLRRYCKVPQATWLDYLGRLLLGGYVAPVAERDPVIYELLRDVGPNTPNLDGDGSEFKETKQDICWKVLRMRAHVSPKEMVAFGVSKQVARTYLYKLYKAGLIQRTEEQGPISYYVTSEYTYLPKAPIIRCSDNAVIDPNHTPPKIWKGGVVIEGSRP